MAIIVAVACCVGFYLLVVAPRLRRARLDRLIDFHRPLVAAPPILATTREVVLLEERLGMMWSLEGRGRVAGENVQTLFLPEPPIARSNGSLEEVIRTFQDPRLEAALAGGEQLIRNAMDMALPNAIEVMTEHAVTGFAAAGKDSLLEHATDFLEHFGHGGHHGAVDALNAALHSAFDAGIHGAGEEVLNNLTDAFDPDAASGAHFPWVSLLFSAQRELRLLSEDRTNIERSLEHLALDTAGVWVGAKTGAAVGSVFGPLGALGGAILGAITGKSVTNDVKQAPLRRAQQAYDAAAQNVIRDAAASVEQLRHRIVDRVEDARRQLIELAGARPHMGALAIRNGLQPEVAEVVLSAEAALDAYRDALEKSHQQRLAEIPSERAHHRWLRISIDASLRERAELQRAEHENEVSLLQYQLRRIAQEDEPFALLNHLLRLRLPMSPQLRDALLRLGTKITNVGLEFTNALSKWAATVSRDYCSELTAICDLVARESRRHEQLVTAGAQRLRPLQQALLRERDALGLTRR